MSMKRTCAISSRKSDLVSADIRGLGAKNLRVLTGNQKISNPVAINATTPMLTVSFRPIWRDKRLEGTRFRSRSRRFREEFCHDQTRVLGGGGISWSLSFLVGAADRSPGYSERAG